MSRNTLNIVLGKVDEIVATVTISTIDDEGNMVTKVLKYTRRRVTNTKTLDEFMQKRTSDVQGEFQEEISELTEYSTRTMDPTAYTNASNLFEPDGAGDRIHQFNTRLDQLEAQHKKNNRKKSDWARLPNTLLALIDTLVDRYFCLHCSISHSLVPALE